MHVTTENPPENLIMKGAEKEERDLKGVWKQVSKIITK